MQRPVIPAEIRRAVLVEAGHRCAIPRCGETEIDVHHIVPWEKCQKHEYSNLIALCPICHRRTHKGEIDRKALLQYKAALMSSGGPAFQRDFDAPIVEIRRRITERDSRIPGYIFEFDFPDYQAPAQRVVSKNLEAWGNELLAQFRHQQATYTHAETGDAEIDGFFTAPSQLKGTYHVIRNDSVVISLEYTLDRYLTGSAHGGRSTRVQNFLISPFQPITLMDLLAENSSLVDLSKFIRERLLSSGKYDDEEWVLRGTEPEEINFSRFVLGKDALRFTFEEYQIDCYAAGRQELWVNYSHLSNIWNQSLFSKLKREDL
jgi:hypothetical protein